MKQNIFEIKQRVQELKEETLEMWRQSSQSEQLEGLENDPVFSMLLSALAYQESRMESRIEQMKGELLKEYMHVMAPYELGHAIPATLTVAAQLTDSCGEWQVDERLVATVSQPGCQFMPLLRSKVINAKVVSVVRIDGRRWQVRLNFATPQNDLSGFTFAIRNVNFENVSVSYKNSLLPVIRPWEYSRLPMTKCFSADCALYNNSQYFNPSMVGMELFARQNIRLFCIQQHDAGRYMQREMDTIDLIFEFNGIGDDFVFDRDKLVINCLVLVEASRNIANISTQTPIVRLTGYQEQATKESAQFLHLFRPDDEQLYGKLNIEVRRVGADRFNPGSLTQLLATLIDKYHTDFYAFQNRLELRDDQTMQTLRDILQRLYNASIQEGLSTPGVYAMLRQDDRLSQKDVSLSLPYLTTHGATVNNILSANMQVLLPSPFDNSATTLVAKPIPGSDEVSDKDCETSLMRYQTLTNDRIVTPADMKLFCYNELQTRYGIDNSLVQCISVTHHTSAVRACGYELAVEIVLADNTFVKRSFADKIPYVEILIQKMMEVRSANIYPIRVTIQIASSKNDK